ncbi:multidrug effflux MFS transporter [Candidatus Albibeggiatoa sp. nov. NOAA]|uniref:multidrug effflux MFS transporter n=1 Tax=Candidatus Albibeggiatoa sp. nov. NOAA TaxID=3162724 RepID=UPI0032FB2E52|nr:multidrug effflux MFS transporter [Thiotrichaceae bacterium]
MSQTLPNRGAQGIEFVTMMALIMSLLALSIDAILPALSQIGSSLGVDQNNANDNQLLLSSVFIGMSLGLMVYGPLSDTYGRKTTLNLGVGIFIIGTIISLFSSSFDVMLLGRLIQGFGAASCRVVSMAMIRDKFEGKEMAKVMSLITSIFIIVPTIAPSIGQGILLFFQWQAIFLFLLIVSFASLTWFDLRAQETLSRENRSAFSLTTTFEAIKESLTHPTSRLYTIASGLTFGGFIGYLNSAQQILQIQYELGDLFSIAFGGLAFSVGIASYLNSRLLKLFSMEQLCLFALAMVFTTSLFFYVYISHFSAQPTLIVLMTYLSIVFFNLGILMGNMNTLSLNPLGHIAGTASSVISSAQTLLSVAIGSFIGLMYDNSIFPLVFGFMFTAFGGLSILLFINYVGPFNYAKAYK